MSILLPATPAPNSATPRPIDSGAWQQPIAGGTTTRLDRPGNHLAVDFTTPRLKMTDARIWLSRILQGLGRPVRMLFPQPGVNVGVPGPALVDGAGQGGLAIALRNLTPGYVIVEGQALNLIDAVGRFYLHICTANVQVAPNGTAVVAIEPMIRAAPADGSAANLAAPVIEGRLIGSEKGLTLKRALADGLQFTIEELR